MKTSLIIRLGIISILLFTGVTSQSQQAELRNKTMPSLNQYSPECYFKNGVWDTLKTPLPGKRIAATSVEINDSIYLIGGYRGWVDATYYYPEFEIYDPLSDTWDTNTHITLPQPAALLAVNVIDNKIWVMAGMNFNESLEMNHWTFYKDINVYDVNTTSWESKSPIPDTINVYAACASDGYIYAIARHSYKSYRYNPETEEWMRIADMRYSRSWPSLISLDGYIYALGGTSSNIDMERYDPVKNEWTKIDDPAGAASIGAHCTLDGELYLVGGGNLDVPLITMQKYNPGTNSWIFLDSIPDFCMQSTATSINGKFYLFGGMEPVEGNDPFKITNKVWEYAPDSLKLVKVMAMQNLEADSIVEIDLNEFFIHSGNLPIDYSICNNNNPEVISATLNENLLKLTALSAGGSSVEITATSGLQQSATKVDIKVLDPDYQAQYDSLVWNDEFDGEGAINPDKWHHQTLFPNGVSWYNNEIQHYTDRIDNSVVGNGTLKIVAKKEVYTDQGYTKKYTSARINSKYAFTYGRIDIRAKLPYGIGTWPALWLLGKNIDELGAYWETQGYGNTSWPYCGEIDIMEHWGINKYISCAVHSPSSYGGTINKGTYILDDPFNEFHVYRLVWTPNKLEFSVDDTLFYTYQPDFYDMNTWPFDYEQYLIMNIALLPYIDPDFTTSSMEIDYVRIYQQGTPSSAQIRSTGQNIKCYPNPTKHILNIEINETITDNLLVELIDITGKQVLNKQHRNTPDNILQLNVSPFSRGVYILRIIQGDRIYTKRIVIE